MLKRCYDHKNEVDWFENCEDICNEFQPTNFNMFFAPKLKQYSDFTDYIRTLNT